jgi:hypothetical protein
MASSSSALLLGLGALAAGLAYKAYTGQQPGGGDNAQPQVLTVNQWQQGQVVNVPVNSWIYLPFEDPQAGSLGAGARPFGWPFRWHNTFDGTILSDQGNGWIWVSACGLTQFNAQPFPSAAALGGTPNLNGQSVLASWGCSINAQPASGASRAPVHQMNGNRQLWGPLTGTILATNQLPSPAAATSAGAAGSSTGSIEGGLYSVPGAVQQLPDVPPPPGTDLTPWAQYLQNVTCPAGTEVYGDGVCRPPNAFPVQPIIAFGGVNPEVGTPDPNSAAPVLHLLGGIAY